MKIKRKNRHGAEVPTHALNDIMFFLLLFFIIVCSTSSPTTIKINPPVSGSSVRMSERGHELAIDENRAYFFDNNPIKYEEIELKFKEMTQGDKDAPLSIVMDKSLEVKDFMEVIKLAREYKIHMFLKTRKNYE